MPRVKTMALGAIPAMSCSATWPPLAAHPAIECTEPDGGLVSSSDRKAVIAFLMLSEDELDLRANRWISADTWELWRAGMSARPSRWPFDAVLAEVINRARAKGNASAPAQIAAALKGQGWWSSILRTLT